MENLEGGPLRRSKWHGIVEGYTLRHLSRPSDRLAALAGISNAIGKVTKEAYIAGVWQSRSGGSISVFDLLWQVNPTDKRQTDAHEPRFVPKRPEPRNGVAPSWSWASVNETVQYPEYGGVFMGRLKLEVQIFRSTVSHFEGYLTGKGKVRRALTIRTPHESGISIEWGSSGQEAPEKVRWAADQRLQPNLDIWLMEIAHTQHFSKSCESVRDSRSTVYALGLLMETDQELPGRIGAWSKKLSSSSDREGKPDGKGAQPEPGAAQSSVRRVSLASWSMKLESANGEDKYWPCETRTVIIG